MTRTLKSIYLFSLCSVLLYATMIHAAWAQPIEHTFKDELSFNEYLPNPKKDLHITLIWLWSEHGPQARPLTYAQQFSQAGFRVIIPALFESYFLPHSTHSLTQIPKKTLWQFIQAQQVKSQQTYLITSDKTAGLILKTLALNPHSHQNLGLILINPNLYIHTPEAGQPALYQSEVTQTNLPIYIFQSQLSPWRWHLKSLRQKLIQGHSSVFTQVLPKVRDRFYFRPDALPVEQAKAKTFAGQIAQSIKLLSPFLAQNRPVLSTQLAPPKQPKKPSHQKPHSGEIAVYTGAQNRPLNLLGLKGGKHALKNEQGKVVLLNFWASWCPPCVHEMPSMARLKTHFKQKDFEILAVNLGENKTDIETFLQAHPVNFPILMDTQGQAVQDWKIFAYPSSFIIDKTGRIRYTLFGGYEWDNAKAKALINQLLNE